MSQPRSCCPISCTLDLVGDKWTLLVIRDLLLGRTQFKEFLASPEGIATNILSDRLHRLVENGLVERVPSREQKRRDTYRLTAKGRELGRVVKEIRDWGLKHLEGTEARMKAK